MKVKYQFIMMKLPMLIKILKIAIQTTIIKTKNKTKCSV